MRTLRIALLLLFMMGAMPDAHSQSILGNLGKKVVKRATNRAVDRAEENLYKSVDKAVDKVVDKAMEGTEEAIEKAADRQVKAIEEQAAVRDSLLEVYTEEVETPEADAEKARKSDERRQQVMKQFAGRPASDKGPFQMSKKGTVITTASKDAKGKALSHSRTTVVNVDYKDIRNFTVETSTEFLDDEKEPLGTTPMTSKATVEEGVVTFDPESMAGQFTEGMEISGDFFFIPDNIEVGDILMDYTTIIAIGPMKTSMEVTDIRVTGRETLEISGRSIDCYIIESKVLSKAIGIKSEMVQKTWYGRSVGQVKTEIYNTKGKLQSINEIVEIEGL